MGEIRINDELYGVMLASNIICLDKDGNLSTLQDELNKIYENPEAEEPIITISSFTSKTANAITAGGVVTTLVLDGECSFDNRLISMSSNKNYITINKSGKYKITINANLYISGIAEATCYLKKNGTIILGRQASNAGQGGSQTYPYYAGEFDLAIGDSLMFCVQLAAWGGDRAGFNAGSELSLVYLSET